MKLLLKLFFLTLFLALLCAPAYLLLSGLQQEPLVRAVGSMRHGDVGRIKDLLNQHDPRGLRDGETRRLQLTERDLNLVLNSSLPLADRQGFQASLADGRADILYTLALPANPLGRYLNLSLVLRQDGPRLALQQLRFGDTAVPTWLADPVVAAGNQYLRGKSAEYRDAMAALKSIEIRPQALEVVYEWRSELADRLQATGRDIFLPADDRQRVLAYYAEIAHQSRAIGGTAVSLDRLLQPLFALAARRSGEGTDAAAENRALLLALGLAVNGSDIEHLVGEREAAASERPGPMKLTLRGRDDLAKHFSISAAITVAGGRGLADTIGVFKEVDDSRGGSGFSFADLLADRAGVSLAQVATGPKARAVQEYMAAGAQESGYMPPFTQLPEGLMELEFKSRYEDLDSATYALVKGEIEKRIGTCTIHKRQFR